MSYRYVVSVAEDLVIEDLRNGEQVVIPMEAFRLAPASGVYRERELIAEHVGFKVRIPVVMEFNMAGCIESAVMELKTAIRLLETESPLKSVHEAESP